MAKKIVGFIKLQVPAGKANPSPPIGPALGQRGLNIMEFCKAFNAQTQGMEPGLVLPVVITAFADKSFSFVLKSPPAAVLIKKALKLDKGSISKTDEVDKRKLERGMSCESKQKSEVQKIYMKLYNIDKQQNNVIPKKTKDICKLIKSKLFELEKTKSKYRYFLIFNEPIKPI